LHQRLKTTTVYVTHDQIEAMTMADQIVVMQGGRIEQVGAPLELYDHPANTFVAGFIGSPAMNMLPGVVKGGKAVLEDGAVLPLPPGAAVGEGAEITYGVRPEHLGVGTVGLAGTVSVVEPTGSETHVVLRVGGRDVVGMFRDRVSFRPGDALTFAPDAEKVHLFDKATSKRLG
jgi:multiple sugar transport system ATP-binding protein